SALEVAIRFRSIALARALPEERVDDDVVELSFLVLTAARFPRIKPDIPFNISFPPHCKFTTTDAVYYWFQLSVTIDGN
ncbi:MAG: hypothetical protein P8104_12995, partial [Gammaproteobacteria bacterium]